VAGVSISLCSVIAEDIVALGAFYADTFDLPEVMELRSDIFRGYDVAGVTLGFSATVVYDMLHIADYAPSQGTREYLTFEAATDAEVDELVAKAVANGAEVRHEPYETYYDAWQAVLTDPEGNVFRINHFR
jgi:uncharacterized glyoxalase superfamily protein PhnB